MAPADLSMRDPLRGQQPEDDGVEQKEATLKPLDVTLCFLAVLVCGTVNNLSYCVVSGMSQELAKHFDRGNQVTLITSAMNASALAGTFISTKCLMSFRYYTRVTMVLLMMVLTYVGTGLSTRLSGNAGLAGVCFFGSIGAMGQVFGEITNLTFLKSMPQGLVGGWGAGTGVAGILGGGVTVVLGNLNFSNEYILYAMGPTVILYGLSFHYLHHLATKGASGVQLEKILGGTGSGAVAVMDAEGGQEDLVLPPTAANIRAAIRASGNIMFNLVAVYCLEYFVYPGLADRETLHASKSWYPAYWMCYNIGVTISRFSVTIFRIKHVEILTVFQFLNVIGWTVEVYTGIVRNSLPNGGGYYIMGGWMVLVGLCGGATYGNCMYLFNTQEGIPDNLRELGTNLGFVMSNIGILLSVLSFSILDETIMSDSVLNGS
eukprot:TRINITY_DN21265_c0_g1_i2.p1 TRINITY_DN21265_c0_g1~~TRINITY_DN21265_c0_g1_i2.p1  ORF type:complete len:450 (-),score=66.15 TRINITY_DN21265_c0_g1_i2:502-1797(-)